MALSSFSGYDIMTGKLNVMAHITIEWKDEFLRWNETDFGAVSRINVASDEVWVPSFKQEDDSADDFMQSALWLHSNGTIYGILAGEFISYCEIDLLYFPLDQHMCYITLYTLDNTASELKLTLMDNKLDTSVFSKHGEWNITDSEVLVIQYHQPDLHMDFVGYIFIMTINRRPEFIILHTAAPLIMIGCLNMMIYVVPVQSGERVSFSITILLALIFFFSGISDDIPNNALKIPIFSVVCIGIISLCTFNVILSAIFCRIAGSKRRPVPKCLKKIIRFSLCSDKERKYVQEVASEDVSPSGNGKLVAEKDGQQCQTVNLERQLGMDEVTWQTVVDVLDMVMFIVHLVIVSTCIIIAVLFIKKLL